jgi:hypothetical protein
MVNVHIIGVPLDMGARRQENRTVRLAVELILSALGKRIF